MTHAPAPFTRAVFFALAACVAAMLLPGMTAARQSPAQTGAVASEQGIAAGETISLGPSEAGALAPASLRYLGAFRLPPDGAGEENAFSWGGEALAFNPGGDGGKRSLFVTGHNWHTRVAEVSLAAPSLARATGELNESRLLQGFADIRGTLFDRWNLEIPRVGLEVLDGTLFFCWGAHFEEPVPWGTHGARSTDLTLPAPGAVCRIGGESLVYAANDYLFAIPAAWRDRFGGRDLATGRFRDGGWGGMGPSLFALRSADILSAAPDGAIPAAALLRYDDSYGGDEGDRLSVYSHADSWSGGAWADTPAGSAVLFAGTHGFGKTWYGFANGVEYPLGGNEDEVYPEVPEWPYDQRGWWNGDFRPVLLFYDPARLAAAAAGDITAGAVQPYAMLDLSALMLRSKSPLDMQLLGDMALDAASNVLYLLELFADGDRPVVHAFSLMD